MKGVKIVGMAQKEVREQEKKQQGGRGEAGIGGDSEERLTECRTFLSLSSAFFLSPPLFIT